MHERIIRLFTEHFGSAPSAILELAGDGSTRTYLRLVDGGGATAVAGIGPDREENRAFIAFSRQFRDAGLPVPEIYGVDEEAGVWLEEDLGDTTLFDALADARDRDGGRFPPGIVPVYRRVLEELPRFQVIGGRVIDFGLAYPRAAFDSQSILWDLNYFKYHFLKLAHVPFSEARLEEDFTRLTDFLLGADASYFLYRDFQSRNVMLRDGEPWFIDYQGGRRGALQYDVASLLYDAKAAIPDELRVELLDHYLDALQERVTVDRGAFRELYIGFVLVRIMQALGAYGYRGFFERKLRFLQSVPYAARNLATLLDAGLPLRLPELDRIYRAIIAEWGAGEEPTETPGLTVHIGSFSYRRGYPADHGGHGGGFVFDCRALPNPGRLPEFRELSGRDPAVVAYLEVAPETERFWQNVRNLVEAQVQEYLRRGFQSLTVMFGCTGGQHRSVYFAERLARDLAAQHPVHVRLTHREEPQWGRQEPASAEAVV
jgi:aminoglycoside/choline kinase family phosphotransferase